MHGTLRFILAMVVTLSHLGVTLNGYNPGVVAVVIFYLLAGMVAYKLNIHNYANKPFLYYRDRIKRIFPLYLLALLFSYCIYVFGAKSYFLSSELDFLSFISNILVVPLSYYMYTGIDTFTLLPPVWSLGVELQFYILAPFLLKKIKTSSTILVSSLCIYIVATLGYINTDYFGYRLIVGVLFIFLLGSFIQESIENHTKSKVTIILLVYIIIFCLFIYLYSINYKVPYNFETQIGLLIGIPLLYFFRLRFFKAIDKYLGQLSYAVFLFHFPILWALQMILNTKEIIYPVVFVTIIVSILSLKLLNTIKQTSLKSLLYLL